MLRPFPHAAATRKVQSHTPKADSLALLHHRNKTACPPHGTAYATCRHSPHQRCLCQRQGLTKCPLKHALGCNKHRLPAPGRRAELALGSRSAQTHSSSAATAPSASTACSAATTSPCTRFCSCLLPSPCTTSAPKLYTSACNGQRARARVCECVCGKWGLAAVVCSCGVQACPHRGWVRGACAQPHLARRLCAHAARSEVEQLLRGQVADRAAVRALDIVRHNLHGPSGEGVAAWKGVVV